MLKRRASDQKEFIKSKEALKMIQSQKEEEEDEDEENDNDTSLNGDRD